MHKAYEEYDAITKREKQELKVAIAANQQLQDEIKTCKTAITKLQEQTRDV